MKTKHITTIIALFLAIALCFTFASCGKQSAAVDIVKNGEFNDYPGKPFEKTILDVVDKNAKANIDEIKWEDASETFESVLDENESMVRCEFTLHVSDEEANYVLTFLVDNEKQTFLPFSVSINGEVSTDSSEINAFYNGIFGDS